MGFPELYFGVPDGNSVGVDIGHTGNFPVINTQ
jgi:hypothetical protein